MKKIEKEYGFYKSKGQKLSMRLHRLRGRLQALEYYVESSTVSLPSDLKWYSDQKRWFKIAKDSNDRETMIGLFSSVREDANGLFIYQSEISKAKEQIKMLKVIIPRLMLKRALIKQEAKYFADLGWFW
jgi:hypothetical protein